MAAAGELDLRQTGDLMRFTIAVNFCGLPALSVPVGHSTQGATCTGAQNMVEKACRLLSADKQMLCTVHPSSAPQWVCARRHAGRQGKCRHHLPPQPQKPLVMLAPIGPR